MRAARRPTHVDTVLVQHQAALDALANEHTLLSFDPVFLALARMLYPTLARRAARTYAQTFDDPVRNQALRAAGLVSPQVAKAARTLRRRPPSRLTNVFVTDLRPFFRTSRAFFCIEDQTCSIVREGTPLRFSFVLAPLDTLVTEDYARALSDAVDPMCSHTLSSTVGLD